ncbi:MAG: diguanylate cyclase [Thermodesulfobacterium sp.]|nr:diguanylate cyclase [Thermodesulfobacterium sp.]
MFKNSRKSKKNIEKFSINGIKITASIGLSCYAPEKSLDDILKQADDALYEAKRNGKNCILCIS